MTETVLGRRVASPPVAALVLLAGCAWLVARPELRGVPNEAAILSLGYVAIAVAAISVSLPTAAGPASVPNVLAALAFGLGCVLLVGRLVGPPVPIPASGVAPVLNVLAAIAEEALFRGLAFGWLRRSGPVVAVIGTAAAFALIHVPAYGIEALPVDLGAGLLLSWQRMVSGTWSVPAATHAAANLLAVIR